jgi:hypothetical protein
LDIQAVVGRTWTKAAGAVCCLPASTNNSAQADFWGWHATANERGVRDALVGRVALATTLPNPQCPITANCPPPFLMYGSWEFATPVCPIPHRINMAFELLTSELATPLPCPKLVLTTAVSVKVHTNVPPPNDFGINLPLAPPASAGTECRTGGPTQIRLRFSEDIAADDGSLDPNDEVKVSAGNIASLSISSNVLTVNLTNVPENSCLRVEVENGPDGITTPGSDVLDGDNDVHVIVLKGDTTDDHLVNLLDLQAIKLQLFQPVGPGNFKLDVNHDGLINLLDLQEVKLNLFKAAVCP